MTPTPTRQQALILPFDDVTPDIDPSAWLAPNATVIGSAVIRAQSSIWFGAVVRADTATIVIGAGSNIQDGCALHADPDAPLAVGSDVAVGHHAVLHGCTIDDGVLIGMHATVLNGARVGSGSLVAAGTVVLENMQIPPRSLVAGVPAKVRRATTHDEMAMIAGNTRSYRALARSYRYSGREHGRA